MTIHEATISKLQQLPEPLVQEVNQFIDTLISRNQHKPSEVSAYELTQQWLGSAELPADLSHNLDYMDGYGQ